jgi:hypothetical protein
MGLIDMHHPGAGGGKSERFSLDTAASASLYRVPTFSPKANMKKPKANTLQATLLATRAATRPLPDPPAHCTLRATDVPYWRAVMLSRAIDEWSEADLVIAAQLARCMADVETEARQLDSEGAVISGRKNPRAAIVDSLVKREQAFLRTLRMGGRVAGDARDESGRRRLERHARQIHDELVDEDDLLAR